MPNADTGHMTWPSLVDFASSASVETQNLPIYTDRDVITITAVSMPANFTCTTTLPLIINPGNVGNLVIQKAAVATMGPIPTMTFTYTVGINPNPFTTQPILLGNPSQGPANDTQNVTLQQSSFNLGSMVLPNLTGGTFSQAWVIQNNAASTLTINAINLINTSYTYSNIQTGTTIAAGGTLTVTFTCNSPILGVQEGSGTSGGRLASAVFVIVGYVGAGPATITMTGALIYKGLNFTSLNTLTGTSQVFATLFGTTLKVMDPTNLTPEVTGYVTRQYDFGTPGFEKYLGRFYLRLENLGDTSFQLTLTSTNGNAVTVSRVITTSPSPGIYPKWVVALGQLQGFLADAIVNGEIITFQLTAPAIGEGPLSIVMFGFLFEERGEIYESA